MASGLDPNILRDPLGQSPWQGIMKLSPMFKAGLIHIMGDGIRTHLREDVRCGEKPLNPVYLEVYFMAIDPKVLVASYVM